MQFKFILYSISIILLFSCSKKKASIIVKKGTITESVYASGVIKAEGQYPVYSTVSGILQKINVSPHQNIKAGEILFELERDKADLSTENARLAYELSQENNRYIQDKISELEMRVQLAKEKLNLDESIYNRNKRIKEAKVLSEVDFEKVVISYNSSKLNYETALKQLDQFKAQLKNERSRNAVNLKMTQKTQNDFQIKSAFSGELYDVLVKEGTLITPQMPLAIIGKSDDFLLELEVDENDMARIQLGQKVLITMDSYKEEVFEALVDKIFPIMNLRSRTFKIEAHFTKKPPKLFPNLSVEANIVIQTKKNTITIPKEYLLQGDSVWIDNKTKRKVTVGLSDYQNVEIISGLKFNETIIKPE